MRATGAVIICLCALFFGSFLCSRERMRIAVCEELLTIMRYIRDEITKNKTPTRVIFSRLSVVCLPPSFICALLRTNDLYGALVECASALPIDGAELEIVRAFSSRVGMTAAENQAGEFDYCIEKLNAHTHALLAALPAKQRLGRVIPVFIGVLFVIIFI